MSTCTDQLVDGVVSSDSGRATSVAQAMSSGLHDLVQASRAVAATSGEPLRVLTATEETLERCWTLLRESGSLLASPSTGPEERDVALEPLRKGVQESLLRIQSSIPGQREMEDAIQNITSTSWSLDKPPQNRVGKNYG